MGDLIALPFDPTRYRAGFEPEEIKLDDVEVTGLGGITRRLFVGQSVWVDPFPDGEHLEGLQAAYARIQTATSAMENEEAVGIMHDCLSNLVVAWNVTDKYGEPLPQPFGNPAAFERMHPNAEVALLNRVLQGAPAAPDGPKESAGSPATSSNGKARRSR